MYFVDSIRANSGVLRSYDPNEIAQVSVFKDANAIKVAGKDSINGAIFIITKPFAREHYWNYFKTKSLEYQKSIPDLNVEAKVVYILNNKVLTSNFEGDLFNVNDTNFIELLVLDTAKLKKEYNIKDRPIGVIIKTSLSKK